MRYHYAKFLIASTPDSQVPRGSFVDVKMQIKSCQRVCISLIKMHSKCSLWLFNIRMAGVITLTQVLVSQSPTQLWNKNKLAESYDKAGPIVMQADENLLVIPRKLPSSFYSHFSFPEMKTEAVIARQSVTQNNI